MKKNTIGYTFEEIYYDLCFEDINETILEKIRHSACVKSARKVGKKLFHPYSGKYFKEVCITIDQDALTEEQSENFCGDPVICYISVPA